MFWWSDEPQVSTSLSLNLSSTVYSIINIVWHSIFQPPQSRLWGLLFHISLEKKHSAPNEPKTLYIWKHYSWWARSCLFWICCGRNMWKAGAERSVIMKLTGHKTMAMFLRYSTVDKDDEKDAMEKLDRFLEHKNCSYSAPERIKRKK